MPTKVRAVVAGALVTAAVSVVQQAHSVRLPDLVARSASSRSAIVERGATFTANVKVKNVGQAPAGSSRTRFYLSKDRSVGRSDHRLAKTSPAPRLAAGKTSKDSTKLIVPLKLTEGGYYLLACADDKDAVKERTETNNCRASKARVGVIPGATTQELVESDVTAGKISAQQGLVYKVFAAFGDNRLPRRYKGDDTGVVDSQVMAEVAEAFETLPPDLKSALIPFIRAPAYPDTWEELSSASSSHQTSRRAGRRIAGADPPVHPSPLGEEGWGFYEHPRARIWFTTNDDRAESIAAVVYESLEEVWADLTELMGREPPSDEGPHEFTDPQGMKQTWGDGGGGALDIYIVGIGSASGLAVAYPPGCSERPSFIMLNTNVDLRGERFIRSALAHEFMHVLQLSYKRTGPCVSDRSWSETVAEWAMDYVYPSDQIEHEEPSLITYPQGPGSMSLWDAEYDGWPFPLYLEHTQGAQTIPAIYSQMATKTVWGAVDAGVSGGFDERWPEFARHAWNQEPVSPNLNEWDSFARVPGDGRGGPIPTTTVVLGVKNRVSVPVAVSALSRRYDVFSIDDDILKLTFENGVTSKPGAAVEALVKLENGTWKSVEDWTDRSKVTFCRDRPAEAVSKLIVITSNSMFMDLDDVLTGSHKVWGTSECLPERYTGTYTGTKQGPQEPTYSGPTETWTATGVILERGARTNDGNGKPFQGYNVAAGTVAYEISGGSPCSYDGAATFDLSPEPPQVATGGHLDLEVRPGTGQGRRYQADVYDFSPHQFTITIDCGDGPTNSTWYALSEWSTGGGYFEAQPGDSLVDTYDPPRGSSGDDFEWQWNFTPEFEGT